MLVGILPLYSHKNAEFLHNEVPGDDHPRRHPRADAEGRLGRASPGGGRARSPRRRSLAARELGQGVYIMPPFNKVDLAVRVIEVLR